MTGNDAPKIVLCAGLPRSGSTWVYNATLMLLRSRTRTTGLFSDKLSDEIASHADDDACVVVKCHAPDTSLVLLAKMLSAPIILSVRDPRDCVVSLEAVFDISQEQALFELSKSAARLVDLAGSSHLLVIKYEDEGEKAKTIEHIAAHLGVPATPEQIAMIADELDFEAMKKKIAGWEADGVLDASRPAEVWTDESHWHAGHCGDGLVGKYSGRLSPNEIAAVENKLRPFFEMFGYASEAPPALKSGDTIHFGGDGIRYAFEGFSYGENWGVWTEQPTARIVVPLKKAVRRVQLALTLMRGACLSLREGAGTAVMFVNDRKVANLFADPDSAGDLLMLYDGPASGDRLEIRFEFENLVSPKALGLSADERLLGIGIRTLDVTY